MNREERREVAEEAVDGWAEAALTTGISSAVGFGLVVALWPWLDALVWVASLIGRFIIGAAVGALVGVLVVMLAWVVYWVWVRFRA